ncbi:conjugal transfer protein TraF [Aliivibrio fischeri]|uniref:conjugal transfer protein TraF n=1 Tax=Aliivibrio fischeri TaxID=668 RepID=UPI00307FD28D
MCNTKNSKLLNVYYVEAAVNNFDFKDFDKNKTTDNSFNVDVGAVGFTVLGRFAAAGKNLIKMKLKPKNHVNFADSQTHGRSYGSKTYNIKL